MQQEVPREMFDGAETRSRSACNSTASDGDHMHVVTVVGVTDTAHHCAMATPLAGSDAQFRRHHRRMCATPQRKNGTWAMSMGRVDIITDP